MFVSGSDDTNAIIWNAETGQLMHILKGHTQKVRDVTINTHNCIITVSDDKTLRVWNTDRPNI